MKLPSHSTVVAYLALFVAVGGGAYAVARVDSGDIRNRSIQGKDVAPDTLGGKQINEAKLAGGLGADVESSAGCDPAPGDPTDCLSRTVRTTRETGLLIIAVGSKTGEPGGGVCEIEVDSSASNGQILSGAAADAFALTEVTAPLRSGRHTVALRCTETSGNFRVERVSISIATVGALPN